MNREQRAWAIFLTMVPWNEDVSETELAQMSFDLADAFINLASSITPREGSRVALRGNKENGDEDD